MYKAKLCGFALACMVGFTGIGSITAFAAETNTDTVTLTQNEKNFKENRAAFEQKMKEAGEKWKALSAKQKQEVYSLMEDEMKTEMKVMDKLVELGVIKKEDAAAFTSNMQQRYNKMKENGEFPFMRPRPSKSRK